MGSESPREILGGAGAARGTGELLRDMAVGRDELESAERLDMAEPVDPTELAMGAGSEAVLVAVVELRLVATPGRFGTCGTIIWRAGCIEMGCDCVRVCSSRLAEAEAKAKAGAGWIVAGGADDEVSTAGSFEALDAFDAFDGARACVGLEACAAAARRSWSVMAARPGVALTGDGA
jgi:hypothetical protein